MTASKDTELENRLRHALLVHTDADKWELAIERSDRDGGGLVLHGPRGLTSARYIKEKTDYRRELLVEASAYSGKGRKLASDPFDHDWMNQQRRLGLAAILPDAGYIDQDDEAGLVSILSRVKDDRQDTVALLALNRTWMDHKHGLSTLKHHIADAGVPVALVLEHSRDPLSRRYALAGLVSLFDTGVPVMLLRCDASAVGALCFGALAAAVGTRTGLRHLYPLGPGSGGPTTPSIAVLVRGMLSYISLEKLDLAYSADPDNHLWWCDCEVCGGRDLSWLGSAPNPEVAAYLHSVEVLYQIRHDLFEEALTPTERRQAWIAQCDAAIFQHDWVAENIGWDPQPVLGNWTSLRDLEAAG